MSIGQPEKKTSIQVITIKPGEQFSLPPNADIVYASDLAAMQSECDLNRNWTERCFRLAYENNTNPPIDDATFISYIIDGTEIPLENPFPYTTANLEVELTNSVPLGLFTYVTRCNASANVRIIFKSIGREIFLKVLNPTGHDSVGGGETYLYIPAEQIIPCDCTGALGDESSLAA